LKYYQRLQKQLPVAMGELTAVEGVGPKTVQALYKKLKITNLQELEQAARQHKIHELSGFKEKTEENILRGIDLLKKTKERRPLRAVLPVAEAILKKIKQHQSVSQAEVAGSLRRRESTVGDIDMLAVSSRGKEVVDLFCGLPEVDHVYSKGSTKALVRLKQGIDADLRVVPAKSFGAALQYFTGNKAHSIATRKLAQKRGMKLNEYGLFKGEKPVAGRSEQGIYRALGLPHIPPEERNEKLPITDKRSNEKA
jgi:DNA polymerase (family X)